jgi:hypothetical protein
MNLLWGTLEKYWKEIPESKLPVLVANLRAIFEATDIW